MKDATVKSIVARSRCSHSYVHVDQLRSMQVTRPKTSKQDKMETMLHIIVLCKGCLLASQNLNKRVGIKPQSSRTSSVLVNTGGSSRIPLTVLCVVPSD